MVRQAWSACILTNPRPSILQHISSLDTVLCRRRVLKEHWDLRKSSMPTSIWRMNYMKATLRSHARVSRSVHRDTDFTSITPGLILPVLGWALCRRSVISKGENYMPSGVVGFGLWLWQRNACKNIDLQICSEVVYFELEIAENHSWMKPVLNWFIQRSHKVMNQYF